jgi:hypothetical protein
MYARDLRDTAPGASDLPPPRDLPLQLPELELLALVLLEVREDEALGLSNIEVPPPRSGLALL